MNEQVIAAFPLCYEAVRFQAAVCDHLVAVDALEDDLGLFERLVRFAFGLLGRRAALAGGNLVQFLLIDEVRQFLVLHLDGASGVFGRRLVNGGDEDDLIARPFDLCADILNLFDDLHAGHLLSRASVNARDFGVRIRRAHDLAEEHPGAVDVVSVFRPA